MAAACYYLGSLTACLCMASLANAVSLSFNTWPFSHCPVGCTGKEMKEMLEASNKELAEMRKAREVCGA